MCSYTAFRHFSGSLDGPDRTNRKVRPASGHGLRPIRSRAVAFIAITSALKHRLWIRAIMLERGILAEAGPAGQHGGTELDHHESIILYYYLINIYCKTIYIVLK